MDSQEKLDEARARANEAARTKDAAELRWRELEHAKAQATGSREAFDQACEELAKGERALELAQLGAERADEAVAAAEKAHASEVLGRVSKAFDLSLAHLKGPKVQGLKAAFRALHEAVAAVEESIRQTAALSYELGRLAETAGDTRVQAMSPGAVRAQALAVYLRSLHAAFEPAHNLRAWLVTPPSSLEELAERLRALLDYPSFSTRFSDLDFPLEQQVAAMLDGTFYAQMRERQTAEKRRTDEQIEERHAEQRAAFEADVNARMRAGAADRRTAIDRAMATMQHDASVVLPAVEAQP